MLIYIKQQAQYVAYNIDVSFSFSPSASFYKYQGRHLYSPLCLKILIIISLSLSTVKSLEVLKSIMKMLPQHSDSLGCSTLTFSHFTPLLELTKKIKMHMYLFASIKIICSSWGSSFHFQKPSDIPSRCCCVLSRSKQHAVTQNQGNGFCKDEHLAT